MTTRTAFLRIDDRLIHGQVIVGWLPEVKPEQIFVINDKTFNDIMRQEMMSLSIPPDMQLGFFATKDIKTDQIGQRAFILVASPEDAWKCLQNGITPSKFNVGGMHAKENKQEIFEALHIDHRDRSFFEKIIESGVEPFYQPTPQNEPISLIRSFQ